MGNLEKYLSICLHSLGESCSHVGGLLCKMEFIVRIGGTELACTDELCKWNQTEWKGVPPAPLSLVQLWCKGEGEQQSPPTESWSSALGALQEDSVPGEAFGTREFQVASLPQPLLVNTVYFLSRSLQSLINTKFYLRCWEFCWIFRFHSWGKIFLLLYVTALRNQEQRQLFVTCTT